jgi:hypothetical protein
MMPTDEVRLYISGKDVYDDARRRGSGAWLRIASRRDTSDRDHVVETCSVQDAGVRRRLSDHQHQRGPAASGVDVVATPPPPPPPPLRPEDLRRLTSASVFRQHRRRYAHWGRGHLPALRFPCEAYS